MNRLITLLAIAATIILCSPTRSWSQSKGAADANAAAYDLYSAGDYKAATAAYEKLVKDYPTDAVIPVAQVQLAFCYYFLGEFDNAQNILTKALSGPPLSPELKQIVDGFVPQILSAKGAAMPPNDPKRQATFEDAIKKFTDFINTYPQSPDLESAIYSRAIAAYQIRKYDDVVKDLELNLQKFPNSSTLPASKNLLAITLATQGSLELNKKDAANSAAAFALYKRATDYLREIIKNKEDVALINDANFQLGEILFNQAVFSPEADRPAIYQQALEAYRSVAPKEQVIKWQQDLLKDFPSRKLEAIKANNAALRKQLDKENERELKKLAELQGKPDQVANAMLKMGEIFFQKNQPNEARVIIQHTSPFLDTDDSTKRALYFIAMTYAQQNAADRAASAYNDFQAKYKGDALADNLPFAMGMMYLGLNNLPEAVKYFNESIAIYPKGRFAGHSVVNKALAESRLKQYDAAGKTFQDFLSKNPPPEIGVVAQYGLAGIYKDTGKWDDALAAYKKVKDVYPGTPQATESDYWIGFATQQKGDNAAAIPLLDAFAKANPKSPLAPLALYIKASAQVALNQREDAFASMTEVANQYPDSPPAPFTYFLRANIRGQEGKSDEVVALMKDFIAKYPKDDKVFIAYDSIAQASVTTGKTDDAVAMYREYVQNYSDNPQAGDALYKISSLQLGQAQKLGRYGALNEQERSLWKTLIDASIASSEELVKKYPDSTSLAPALQTLLTAQRLLASAELKKASDVQDYFQALANDTSNSVARSKILFTLASYVAEQDKARALEIMDSAYKPEIVFAPESVDYYGLALIDQKRYDQAIAVFDNLAKQYPNPPGVTPTQAPALVQNAQAIALFGRGSAAQSQGQTAEAGKYFEQLKALYPWSPKVLEANYGIAAAYKQQQKYDEALQLLGGIVRAPNATAKLRADSMLLGGYIMIEKWKTATDPKEKDQYLGAAIDYFIKIAQFYGGEPTAAAEGLWMGAQLLEQQAASITDPKAKTQQLNRAKEFYQQLVKEYPNSEYVPKAQERLKALGTP